jgi:hypothetical protein
MAHARLCALINTAHSAGAVDCPASCLRAYPNPRLGGCGEENVSIIELSNVPSLALFSAAVEGRAQYDQPTSEANSASALKPP